MPTIAIDLTPGDLGPTPCYTDEQTRYNAYIAATQSSLPINFTTVIVQQTAPNPDDRDKVWIKTDGSGRIIGTFLFSNGTWQDAFPAAPYLVTGEFRYYDPSLYTPVSPWFPCDNTVVGVPDLRGRFMVSTGQRALPTGSTDTNTNFIYGAIGGEETHSLTLPESAPHIHNLLVDGVSKSSTSVTASPGGSGAGDGGWDGHTLSVDNAGGNGATPPVVVPHNNVPPYYALAIMQWRPDLA